MRLKLRPTMPTTITRAMETTITRTRPPSAAAVVAPHLQSRRHLPRPNPAKAKGHPMEAEASIISLRRFFVAVAFLFLTLCFTGCMSGGGGESRDYSSNENGNAATTSHDPIHQDPSRQDT